MLMFRVSAMVLAVYAILQSTNAMAQEAWKEPQDSAAAITDPDRYAWRLFVAVNWPANVKQKAPDSARKFGDAAAGPVVWETWRSANNNAVDTAYPMDGSDPGSWLDKETPADKPIASLDRGALQQQVLLESLRQSNTPLPAFEEDLAKALENEDIVNETRLNQATFEFVRSKKLYNLDEQIKLFTDRVQTIDFPLAAKEVKAQWREISVNDEPRYHWVKSDNGKIYGLTALHITTKDLPKWLWATFEHIDNKIPESQGGRKFNVGWNLKSVDRFACPQAPHDCEKAPTGIGLEGTKWSNYRLRGTQIDFVDSRGNITLLANSQPEGGFQNTSSCITCHARATIGAASRLSVFRCQGQSSKGMPIPTWFTDASNNLKFTQLDFVWSLFRARRSNKTGAFPPQDPPC
ncbi:hypothetical protein IVB08_10070 [Bradyrhizobium sp. 173]|uniref:hypothetical protein n=1 Tax=Bradyrhizobium sp. 173 TaxID=2782644 RepID=UPI001FFA70B5|nr:hypothetical protein [Bradyrhizobium sp. 173]MCK1564304.1 hypothetical protein [Bradyrhizobium sp. 173]